MEGSPSRIGQVRRVQRRSAASSFGKIRRPLEAARIVPQQSVTKCTTLNNQIAPFPPCGEKGQEMGVVQPYTSVTMKFLKYTS